MTVISVHRAAVCASLCAVASVAAAQAVTPPGHVLYVAPDGDDAWSGRMPERNAAGDDGPFATITRARDAVRDLKAGGALDAPVTVRLRGGVYFIDETIRFGPEDSGTEGAPVTYAAYPGEQPELVGGRPVEGLKAGEDGVMQVELPAVRGGEWHFRQLFIDGERQHRARCPNFDPEHPYRGGFLYVRHAMGGFGAGVGNIHNRGDRLDYLVKVPAEGEYVLWTYYGAHNEPFGRTDMDGRTSVTVDEGEPVPLTDLRDTGGWTASRWSRSATLSLSAGQRRIRWRNEQGGGLNLDAFALSDDPDWRPEGTDLAEPAEGRHVVVFHAEDYVECEGPQISSSGGGSKTQFRYAEGEFDPVWAAAPDAELHIFQSGSCRAFKEIVAIDAVDTETHTVTLSGPECRAGLGTGDRYFVENVRSELDAPGEWYLDRESGVLSIIPPEGFSADSEVIAPAVGRLIEFAGTEEAPVEHVRLSGLTIRCTDYSPEDGCGGYGMGTEGVLHFENAAGCAVERCTFTNTGRYAVCLEGGESNAVTGCDISESAEGGVLVIGSAGNVIEDNHIHDCGAIYKHIGGVVLTGEGSDENRVAHNLIHHMSRYGITIKNGGLHNVIEFNRVHHTNLETYDTGAIEVTQHDPDLRSGSVIRNNIVGDTVGWYAQGPDRSVHLSWAIYLDSYAGGYTVTDNITFRNSHGGIMLQGGKDNVVTNNIFVESSVSQMQINNFRGNSTGEVIERNIIYWTDPEAAAVRAGKLEPDTISIDRNLYWCPGADEFRMATRDIPTFAAWQEAGYDTHSLIEDPLFVAPEQDDYRLRPGSPAFDLGFETINTRSVGLLTPRE